MKNIKNYTNYSSRYIRENQDSPMMDTLMMHRTGVQQYIRELERAIVKAEEFLGGDDRALQNDFTKWCVHNLFQRLSSISQAYFGYNPMAPNEYDTRPFE